MHGFSLQEFRILKSLSTPVKIQDFLETIPINFEKKGETCMSPARVLKEWKAHCIEGAMLAAAAFMIHHQPPLLLDLKASDDDDDHAVALFRHHSRWGAVSKSNHATLRYRDPIYKTVRELALSYFNEYINDDGKKTLRSFSKPFNLRRFGTRAWTIATDNLWNINDALDESPHESILTRATLATLRGADPIERTSLKLTDWKK